MFRRLYKSLYKYNLKNNVVDNVKTQVRLIVDWLFDDTSIALNFNVACSINIRLSFRCIPH